MARLERERNAAEAIELEAKEMDFHLKVGGVLKGGGARLKGGQGALLLQGSMPLASLGGRLGTLSWKRRRWTELADGWPARPPAPLFLPGSMPLASFGVDGWGGGD